MAKNYIASRKDLVGGAKSSFISNLSKNNKELGVALKNNYGLKRKVANDLKKIADRKGVVRNSDVRELVGSYMQGKDDGITAGRAKMLGRAMVTSGRGYDMPGSRVPEAKAPELSKSSGPAWGSFGVSVKAQSNVPSSASNRINATIRSRSLINLANKTPSDSNWGNAGKVQKLKVEPASKVNRAGISPSFDVVDKNP